MAKDSLAGQRRRTEELQRTDAQAACLEQAVLFGKDQSLVKINQPRPNEVFFLDEHGSGLSEKLQGAKCLFLLAKGDGVVRKSFGCFVTQLEFAKAGTGLLSHFRCFPTQI